MKAKRTSGYSSDVAKMYIPEDTEIVLLSTKLVKQVEWNEGKPTDKVTGYKILCGLPDDFFSVKFNKKVDLPPFCSRIKFKGLEACEVEKNMYFRAEDLEEVK